MKIIFLFIFFMMISCSDGDYICYEVKDNTVLYHSVYRKGQEYYMKAHYTTVVLKDADSETFVQLSKYYGVDKSNVYNESKQLKQRDPSTFKVLSEQVTADKYGVYFENKLIDNSEGISFKFISNDYAIDNNQAYYISSNLCKVVNGVDRKTFIMLGDKYSNYAYDKNNVYFEGYLIKNANPYSFKILESNFSKDSVSIFFRNQKIKEVDYNSFRILSIGEKQKLNYKFYAEDNSHYYGQSSASNNGSALKIEIKNKNSNEIN